MRMGDVWLNRRFLVIDGCYLAWLLLDDSFCSSFWHFARNESQQLLESFCDFDFFC